MSKAERLFKHGLWIFVTVIFALPWCAQPLAASDAEGKEISTYREMFDQNVFDDLTSYLHLDRLYRAISHKKIRAQDVNAFDEVPDGEFFMNRHGRSRLSPSDLEKGFQETTGPDLSGNLTAIGGEFLELQPGYFVIKDSRDDQYILKFDPFDHLELVTSSEVIANRFYHAIGYNVLQCSIVTFAPQKLVPGEGATFVDNSGFRKKLTAEQIQNHLLFLPQDSEGRYRASASKMLSGTSMGNSKLTDRKDRREIRALRVFASWLNTYRMGKSNTLVVSTDENGQKILKHYLINFESSLGAMADDAKSPMFSYEYFIDYGETLKAFFSFGLWEKPWQKSWREEGEKIHSPAAGYITNNGFHPRRFKTELPYYAFKDLTRADGFWAAKIIMSFSDDDIAAMVKAGQLSNPDDAAYIKDILIKRRDLIGKYWFHKANPLDNFELKNNVLTFEDLAVKHGFEPSAGTVYRIDVFEKKGKCAEKITSLEANQPSVSLVDLPAGHGMLYLKIQTVRQKVKKHRPFVLVIINRQNIQKIIHED